MEGLVAAYGLGEGYAVRLEHVYKAYHPYVGRPVFSNFSLKIKEGAFVAVSGPVGCGKTTLLNLIAGLVRPDHGEVVVLGERVSSLKQKASARWRTAKIGIVPQIQDLISNLSVADNVALPLYFDGMSKDLRVRKVGDALSHLGLSGLGGTVVAGLSTGERQLVAFARAIVTDPAMMLLDEPTEALDPLLRDVLVAHFRSENKIRGRTVLVASHDRRVLDCADRVLNLGSTAITKQTWMAGL